MSRFYACLVSFIMRQNWSNQLVNCSNCLPLVNGSFSILVTMSDLEGLLRNIADSWSRTSIPEVWNRGWREREREREKYSLTGRIVQVVAASSLLRSALESSQQFDEWDDKRGFKCSPPHIPHLPGQADTPVLDLIRKVNDKLSWKIPLQIVDGDANRLS